MVRLGARFFHRGGIRIQVHTKGNAQAGALIGIAAPLVIVLSPVCLLAIPFAAITAADDSKINPGSLGLFPVHFALELGYIDAFSTAAGIACRWN